MKMANFLLPKSTIDSHVNNEAHVDPNVAAVGTVAVGRGPIGDIAAGDVVVVTNHGHDSISFLNPDGLVLEETIGGPGEPFAVVISGDRAYVLTAESSYASTR